MKKEIEKKMAAVAEMERLFAARWADVNATRRNDVVSVAACVIDTFVIKNDVSDIDTALERLREMSRYGEPLLIYTAELAAFFQSHSDGIFEIVQQAVWDGLISDETITKCFKEPYADVALTNIAIALIFDAILMAYENENEGKDASAL